MDRARISLLAVCALLSTTFGPLMTPVDQGVASRPSKGPIPSKACDAGATGTEVVSASPPAEVDGADDAAVEAQIWNRLSMRHTGLPERERAELVRVIIQEARAHDLEPGLVVAVIEVESGGYHLATSHVGAMGLMQLLPSTGRELAERLGIEWKGPDTLFDPIINVRLGTAYLRQLADRYGDVDTALAAYNWGPGRIDRRLRRGATVPSRYVEQVNRVVMRNAMSPLGRS